MEITQAAHYMELLRNGHAVIDDVQALSSPAATPAGMEHGGAKYAMWSRENK